MIEWPALCPKPLKNRGRENENDPQWRSAWPASANCDLGLPTPPLQEGRDGRGRLAGCRVSAAYSTIHNTLLTFA